MGQPASFDWHVREGTTQDVTETVASIPVPVSRHKWTLWVVCGLVVLVAGYFGLDMLMRRAEANLEQVEEEVADALLVAGEYRPPNLVQLDADIAEEWGKGVSLLELHMDMALVDVIIEQPSEAWYTEPYHVGRVLRQDGKGWQPIAPAYSFWSKRRTLETNYFSFDYSQRDEDALEAIVADLETIYLRLHEDLALAAPIPGQRIPIKISLVDGSPIRVTDLSYSGDTLIIPPPTLIPRPLDMAEAEALRQTIVYALAVKLFIDSQKQAPASCTWNAVAEGIGLWLRWEDHTLPSRRKWIYDSAIQVWRDTTNAPRLADLLAFPPSCSRPPAMLETEILNAGQPIPRPELAATFIDYLVVTHGRQVLPQMLEGINSFQSWDDLAQEIVDRPVAELEAGWQAHFLAQPR